jgi:hypothetical protein
MASKEDYPSKMRRLVRKAPMVTPEPALSTVSRVRRLIRKSPEQMAAEAAEREKAAAEKAEAEKAAAKPKKVLIRKSPERMAAEAAEKEAAAPFSKKDLPALGAFIKSESPARVQVVKSKNDRAYIIKYSDMPSKLARRLEKGVGIQIGFSHDTHHYQTTLNEHDLHIRVEFYPDRIPNPATFNRIKIYEDSFNQIGDYMMNKNPGMIGEFRRLPVGQEAEKIMLEAYHKASKNEQREMLNAVLTGNGEYLDPKDSNWDTDIFNWRINAKHTELRHAIVLYYERRKLDSPEEFSPAGVPSKKLQDYVWNVLYKSPATKFDGSTMRRFDPVT